MSQREMQLFHQYSETGYRGEKERTVTYTLIIGEGNALATATLRIEDERCSFPAKGDERTSTTIYELPVQDLVALIAQHGRRSG